MPELPEVETIARGLAPEIVGQAVRDVSVRYAGAVGGDAETFSRRVTGKTIAAVRRRGKMLLLDLLEAEGAARPAGQNPLPFMHVAVHLKMTGRLWTPPEGHDPDCHTHVIMRLSNGRELHFRDVRKFGWCRALTPGELDAMPFYAGLGPEPLELAEADFMARFSGRRGRIKGLLLDQRVLAGVGNIYADESLFRARIRPDASAAGLGEKRLRRLFATLCEVLLLGIAQNGASISDYRDARGDAGAFQNSFLVYGRAGKPCTVCGATLKSTTVAGRTTVWCPRCQR
ncbi:formamidopyrimidine-DNA glycosylase [Alkalidesulfovibrio alkalitolerans DSM 16529]|jgi:formamidopyrimidine-DNA glycosylase|uniref:Formamidopyrimidine-DNA glycosylase n=1 Tax=Alkalidesulfovibrio alkalitolerans DSM 16529 TaxID=1121439 RepID=S7UT36_9BACT|nr:bifunctional DNA-formamidopyrimidine glycosylase/DNA-(apurinic or apyrimidinic site) lyase [Alkalidesulfovibrio alkalitolerans]EPR35478.1 formamidopyrimidine-DNA glycosylase [Alkalidesulfovibrio alkalitolerans DSM 16529]